MAKSHRNRPRAQLPGGECTGQAGGHLTPLQGAILARTATYRGKVPRHPGIVLAATPALVGRRCVGTLNRLTDDEGRLPWPVHAAWIFVGFDPPNEAAPRAMFGTFATLDGTVHDGLFGLQDGEGLPFAASERLSAAWRAVIASGRATLRGPGRREGTGAFEDAESCKAVLIEAIVSVHRRGRRPTQDAVAEHLTDHPGRPTCDSAQVRRWLRRFELGEWGDIVAEALTPN